MVAHTDTAEPTRRDFLYITTGAVAAVGAAGFAWPFVAQMNPDASVLALSSIEVDISQIAEGQSVTVNWRGNPVFIRHRTPKEIEEARAVSLDDLPDRFARNENLPEGTPATDENRSTNDAILIMVGVCTHLGCVPLGQQGEFGGWFCPCHGSHYDTAGRIRKGPAPRNLDVPTYEYLTDQKVKIG